MGRESLHEGTYRLACQFLDRLVHLKHIGVFCHVVARNRERYYHLDVVCLAEIGKIAYLVGVQRTDDDVLLSRILIKQSGANVGIDGHIPCTHLGLYAFCI